MYLYKNKVRFYYTQVREDLIRQMPEKAGNRVLEIGAGGCDTLIAIKTRKLAVEVAGVELMKLPDSQQQNPLIDRLFIGNIEQELPDYPADYFDVVLCGDVLEHLVDPWAVVKNITRFLKPGGVIIISCPNVREIVNWSRVMLTGDFKYEGSGIMDKTHLRFFGKKNLIDLLSTEELSPIRAVPNYFIVPRRELLSRLHFGLLDEFFAPQYIVVSRKK